MDAMAGLAVLVAALLVTGCGGGGMSASKPAPTATATPTAPTKDASGGQGSTTVKIVGFEYEPKTVTVKAGSRITWENEDATNHTVTFTKGPRDLGNVDPRKKLKGSFAKPGRYAYGCQYHPNMKGTVVVE